MKDKLLNTSLIPLLLLILFIPLTSCAPLEQAHVAAQNTEAKFVADMFYAEDNARLPFRAWLPKGRPKAVIVALHGFNDYSKTFISTGEYFKKRGMAVYAYDQRGFGMSPGTGIWAGEKNLVSDLKQFVGALKARHPHKPIFLLGESMGGTLVALALADPDFPKVAGGVLVAPAFWGQEAMNPLYRSLAWAAAHTVPYWQVTGEGLHILASNNLPMLRRLGADPLVIKKTRFDAIYGMVQLMDAGYKALPNVRPPLLLLYGGIDQVIPPDSVALARARFTAPIDYLFYPDGYHMLLHDIQGEQVMRDTERWMLEKL